MTALSVHPCAPGRAAPLGAARAIALRVAMVAGAYLVGVHLAAAAGASPDEPIAGGALGPACVGCHHGADDDPPPPDGGLATPEREALAEILKGAAR